MPLGALTKMGSIYVEIEPESAPAFQTGSEFSEVTSLPAPHPAGRHPNCWAAYGHFIFSSVRTRCSHLVQQADGDLLYFRRSCAGLDASKLYAYQPCKGQNAPLWTTALQALNTLTSLSRVDHLNLYISGDLQAGDASQTFRSVANRHYLALAMPCETRDIIPLPPTFELFLQGLGHSNRRHMKARHKEALEADLRFHISANPASLGADERYALGLASRPAPYRRALVDAFDAYALAQPNFWHATLRSPEGKLLSYSCGFLEADAAVMMYQFNHQDHPKLSLSMTMRSFLIRHWISNGIHQILFPMGVGGHLNHAATINPIVEVFFLLRSFPAVAKALLMRLVAPTSDAALMVGTPGFWRQLFLDR